jgi:hypothetical protein
LDKTNKEKFKNMSKVEKGKEEWGEEKPRKQNTERGSNPFCQMLLS